MTDSINQRPTTFSPELVRSVLQRASEIEAAQSSWLTEEELRQVAEEVGLSQRALDTALAELDRARPPAERSQQLQSRQLVKIALIGGAASLAVTLLSADALVAFATLGACSLVLALAHDRQHRLRRFVMSNGALWGGFLMGPMLLFNAPNVVIPLLTLSVTTVLGIGALWARDSVTHKQSRGGPPAGNAGFDRKVRKLWRKLIALNNATEFRTVYGLVVGRKSVA